MVFTRSQKRSLEHWGPGESSNSKRVRVDDTTGPIDPNGQPVITDQDLMFLSSEEDMHTENEAEMTDNSTDTDSEIDSVSTGMTEVTSDTSDHSVDFAEDCVILPDTTRGRRVEPQVVSTRGLQDIIAETMSSWKHKIAQRRASNNPYDIFLQYIDDIHAGSFFERSPVEESKDKLKDAIPEDDIKQFNQQLQQLQDQYKANAPSIIDILKMDIAPDQKQKLLEKLHHYANADILTGEYNATLKHLVTHINKTQDPELFKLEQQVIRSAQSEEYSDDYRKKLLTSHMSFDNKVIAFKRLEIMERYEETDSSEFAKYKNWMDILLSVPFGRYISIPSLRELPDKQHAIDYISNVRTVLDNRLLYLEKPKDQIINVVSQMIRNPEFSINALGLYGGAGLGKCLGVDTPVLMYDGSIKMVQDIRVGDVLMGDDSTPRNVLSLARGREELFEVHHTLHNESYVVNKSHILTLKMSDNKKVFDRKNRNSFVVKWFDNQTITVRSKHFHYNTENKESMQRHARAFFDSIGEDKVVDIPLTKYMELSPKYKKSLQGFKVGVDFAVKEVEFDPYILGVWLGDGSSAKSEITNQDARILHHLAHTLPKYNCCLEHRDKYTYSIKGVSKGVGCNRFLNTLKNLDLLNNKHIPDAYKINSRQNRLELLAGLLDSDGHLRTGNAGYEITQKNSRLAEDIVYLCRSLGFQCKSRKIMKGCYYTGEYKVGEYTLIYIYGNGLEHIPVLCPRKKANARRQIKDPLVTAIDIVPKGVGEYYGFVIDGNHRFMLGNFIVTHNTSIVKSIAEAMGRPFRSISLGGESDASILTGHGFTYVGSNTGRLIDTLIETKCMNPVILFDELDKVSQTHHGREIIGSLIHMTDTTTNTRYNYDKYFAGVEFDLSKILFVFTYNDPSKVDKILLDRLFKIKVENYTFKEKLNITQRHLIANILEEFQLTTQDIQFEDEAVQYVVSGSKADEGMREIKRKFEIIVSRINTLLLTDKDSAIIKLKYGELYTDFQQLPVTVKKHHVDILLQDSIAMNGDTPPPPMGMYL